MASGLITSWQIEGKNVDAVTDFLFLGSKITVDGDRSHEIRTHLLLGKRAMTDLDGVLKSGGINLSTKVHLVKAMVFLVVMYGCESWTIKKAAVAAAAKLLQSCPTLCDLIDDSPPGSSVPGILQARIRGRLLFSSSMHTCMLSLFSCVQLFVILWTVVCQTPQFMGFCWQKYWIG